MRAGLVTGSDDGHDVEYVLTPAGRELDRWCEALGAWGMRWIGELGEEDLDPQLLLWDHAPQCRPDAGAGRPHGGQLQLSRPAGQAPDWWLVLTPEAVDVCDFDPGYEVGVAVTGGLRELVKVWRGDVGWPQALRSGAVTLRDPPICAEPSRRGSRDRSSPRFPARRSC